MLRRGQLSSVFATDRNITELTVKESLNYPVELAIGLIQILLQLYLLRSLWVTVYNDHPTAHIVGRGTLVSYLTLVTLQSWVFSSRSINSIHRRVRDGTVVFDLIRPIAFPRQVMARTAGSSLVALLVLPICIPLVWVAGGLGLPASITALVLYVVSFFLAFCFNLLITTLLSLSAFWLVETYGVVVIYTFVSRLVSGAFIPLWFLPVGFRTVAGALPFQATAFIPASVFVGHLTGSAAFRALLVQTGWDLVLIVLLASAWSLTRRRILIQGG